MKISTALLACILIGSVFYAIPTSNQPPAGKTQSEKGDLKTNIAKFMSGEVVQSSKFPWYDESNGRVEQEVLDFYLRLGEIRQDEFDAFSNPVIYWGKQTK